MAKSRRPKFDPGQLCYLCNERPAVTEDHVPPEGFFPKNWPKGLKLPACEECNGSFSKDDEYCRLLLCFGGFNDTAAQVFNDQIFRSLTRSYELNKRVPTIDLIKRKLAPREVRSKSGLYLGTATALHFNSEDSRRLDRFVARIVCGLHYEHYRSPLPLDHLVKVYFRPDLERLESTLRKMPRYVWFKTVFAALGGQCIGPLENGRRAGDLWFMTFYHTLTFAAAVSSPGFLPYPDEGRPLGAVLQLPKLGGLETTAS